MTNKNIYSLTLVLPNKDQCLLNTMASRLVNAGVEILGLDTLSPSKAVDWQIKGKINREQLDNIWGKFKADYCLQKTGKKNRRRKKLLICDMDSTLIGQECIDELADFANVGTQVAIITEQAMRGELDFEGALIERVKLLKGLPLPFLQKCFDERIRLNKGAKTLCQTMKKHGATTIIVSGGFDFFASRIAKSCGFDYYFSNQLVDDGEKLTGEVKKPILGKDAKLQTLMEYKSTITGSDISLAIGDGANDLAMIKAASLGIAYNAKPIIARSAHSAINYTDLVSALYFQGISDKEMVYSPSE